MKPDTVLLLAIFSLAVVAVAEKVYLVGDGTMAKGGGGHGTDGKSHLQKHVRMYAQLCFDQAGASSCTVTYQFLL